MIKYILIFVFAVSAYSQQHYVFFSRERERIAESNFLSAAPFAGAQLTYSWRELEPEKDSYKFDSIRQDLAFLTAKNKRLFIQLQDVSFDDSIVNLPDYLLPNGVVKQVSGGWIAKRWDAAVQVRFHKLLAALGAEFDGKVEGINLPETSIDDAKLPDFTFGSYRDAILVNMAALKKAFPKSVTIQYANFMPGEWLPEENHGYLRSVYEAAHKLKVGVGGPDLLPYRPGQLKHAYPLIRESTGIVPTAIAVQDGNYEAQNPQTQKRPSIAELHQYSKDNLKVSYVFWCTEEPFYSKELLPYLKLAENSR